MRPPTNYYETLTNLDRPVEIHQLHLRPSDFFTSNPALDVPSKRNETSVLVPCCGDKSVQQEPTTHLQGSGTGVDAQEAGAHVEGKDGEEKTTKGLSKAFSNLLKLGKE